MEKGSIDCLIPVTQLPQDCLYLIFSKLKSGSDKDSLGLTCHHWLQIQNATRTTLKFHPSFTEHNLSRYSKPVFKVTAFHLYKLMNRFSQLQSLSLTGCTDLPDSALTELRNHGSKLQCLYLDFCFGITDHGLSFIASGCPSLSVISLHKCNITDTGLEILSVSCLALKEVNLSYCSHISDNGIRALVQNCVHLRAVRTAECATISGAGFQGCSQTLSCIEADYCELSPEGIFCMVGGGGLEYLDITGSCWCPHKASLVTFGSGLLTKLRALNFRLCRMFGDDIIIGIAKGCPLLEEWNLAQCHAVTLRGWESIATNCNNLEKLHVNRCQNFCVRSLEAIRNGCKRLKVLHVIPRRILPVEALDLFESLRSDVEIDDDEPRTIAPDWAFRF